MSASRVPVAPPGNLTSLSLGDQFNSFRRSTAAGRIKRYAIGSVIAAATSTVVYAVLYVIGASTTTCSVTAFTAGAIPNWILNRRWVWKQRGQVDFHREIVAYVATSIVMLVAASAATAWTNDQVQGIPAHHGVRVLLVTASYLAVFAIPFVLKFALYEFWIFSGRSRVRAAFRSLRQVPSTTEANRTP